MTSCLMSEVILHHLRLFGVPSARCAPQLLRIAPGASDIPAIQRQLANGELVVAVLPDPAFVSHFCVHAEPLGRQGSALRAVLDGRAYGRSLATFGDLWAYSHRHGQPVVCTEGGKACWLRVPVGERGGMLVVVGTDLAGDLVRYRQGDPAQVAVGAGGSAWGFAWERPNYLFEAQLVRDRRDARQADWWALLLAESVMADSRESLPDLLPSGAPGAVVFTGDDDQAFLEKYNEQIKLLSGHGMTYFLHPGTRHTRRSLRRLRRHVRLDLGIHPDALDCPERYGERLVEQIAAYRALVGEAPRSVRNHGFLNDGYWGHLPHWLQNGLLVSSNLPGLDGTVLNGSLLPARVVHGDRLTAHWSILTLLGDGIMYALDYDPRQASQKVYELADAIVADKLPGVMVVNLHPQNVSHTRCMHEALIDVVRGGFISWNLRECMSWFSGRDGNVGFATDCGPSGWWGRLRAAAGAS